MTDLTTGQKPSKPNAKFPIFANATGQWTKKVNGKFCYFGKWDNPKAALGKWNSNKVGDQQWHLAERRSAVARRETRRRPQEVKPVFIVIDLNRLTLLQAINSLLDHIQTLIDNHFGRNLTAWSEHRHQRSREPNRCDRARLLLAGYFQCAVPNASARSERERQRPDDGHLQPS